MEEKRAPRLPSEAGRGRAFPLTSPVVSHLGFGRGTLWTLVCCRVVAIVLHVFFVRVYHPDAKSQPVAAEVPWMHKHKKTNRKDVTLYIYIYIYIYV